MLLSVFPLDPGSVHGAYFYASHDRIKLPLLHQAVVIRDGTGIAQFRVSRAVNICIFSRLVDQTNITMLNPPDYSYYFRFMQTYSSAGFTGISPTDPLLLELEDMMENNDQYFIIGDLISMNIVFSSRRTHAKLGIEPASVTPYHFFEATHPDDIQRHSLGRAKMFKVAQDIFIAKNGCMLMSTNFNMRIPGNGYENTLYQCYIFYSAKPYGTVYLFQLLTNIDSFKKNEGFHYYAGKDMNNFRYPDEELLMIGHPFSDREFEIIQLVGESLSSEQIAEKLYLSPHTVNTHRRNILKKAGKANISDLIYALKEQGLM